MDAPPRPRAADHDRTTRLLLATGVALALTAWWRPPTRESGQTEAAHWAQKTWWRARFDVVAGGDSRTSEAVAPEVLQRHLGGLAVGNFGFALTSLTPRYVDAMEATLLPGSRHRTLLLGASPLAVTRVLPSPQNGFRYWSTLGLNERLVSYHLSPLTRPFERIGTRRLRDFFRGHAEAGHRIFRPDGWIDTAPEPEKPRATEADYRMQFTRYPPAPWLRPALVARVSELAARGIRVVAFRPPTPAWMRQLEEELTDYDEAALAGALRAAGAAWFSPSPGPEAFHSYDGSHLRSDAALAFSEQLGAFLAGLRTGSR